MTRKKLIPRKLRASWLVLPGLMLLLALVKCSLVESTPPNVLMITVDALRADHLELHGYTRSTAPELSKLAERGAYFEAAVVQAPITVPSLMMMMTGKLFYKGHISSEIKTLAEYLKSEGYTTAAFIRNPIFELESRGIERGFETFYCPEGITESGASGKEFLLVAEKQLYAHDLKAEELFRAAQEWLEQNGENQPFFLWIHIFDPHDPYSPPPPYDSQFNEGYSGSVDGDIRRTAKTDNPIWGKVEKNPPPEDHDYIVALYDGEIRYASAQIGAFLEKFSRAGLEDRTLIIVSADHGESLGEHNLWGHALSLYEPELIIPLIMVMPGKIPPGTAISQPVESLDIVPTILSLVGARAGEDLAGKDLTPLFGKGSVEQAGAYSRWASQSSYRMDHWKLIIGEEKGFELYDLQKDPYEKKNVASLHPQLLRTLGLRLRKAAIREILFEEGKTDRPLEEKLKALGYLE